MTPPVLLTIAGSDSGGAAGIAADLTTFAALGCHGTVAITAVTAQCTLGVHRVVRLPAGDVVAQVRAVLVDLPVAAVKTGMLGSAAVAHAIADSLPAGLPLVVDPVLVATSGAVLADDEVITAYREVLLPRATVATPNAEEAALLGPLPCPAVITAASVDVLDGSELHAPAVPTENDHGTGCTHSAALAAYLAHGHALPDAARMAQQFVVARLKESATWSLGRGRGPVSHIH